MKAQLDILTLARSFQGINLKQRGTVHRGGCPCCGASDKKEPFQVDPRPTGRMGPHFHCFSCGESGDVFNLFALQQRGDAQIPKDKFIATVRAAAEAYGIPIPEAGTSARRSPEQTLRAEVQTTWTSAHEYARTRFLERAGRQHSDPDGSKRPLGAGARIGVMDDGLDDHLTKLGFSHEARVRARLTSADLAALAPGVILLRTAGGVPAGFSQQYANREWGHLGSEGAQFEPAFLSARPSGRPTHRVLVLVSDADRAGRLAANLAALAKFDQDEARRVATIGVVAAPIDDPFDADAIARISRRAVILVPAPDTPTRATSEYGARLFAAGIAVRVAEPSPAASGTAPIGDRPADAIAALDSWEQADDYFTWQAKQIPTLQGVASWSSRRVPALLATMPQPAMRDVFAYRAEAAATEARARIESTNAATAHGSMPTDFEAQHASACQAMAASERVRDAEPDVSNTEGTPMLLATSSSTSTAAVPSAPEDLAAAPIPPRDDETLSLGL